jgi:hypothetical protein
VGIPQPWDTIDLTPFNSPSPLAERGLGGEVDKLNNNGAPPDPSRKEFRTSFTIFI